MQPGKSQTSAHVVTAADVTAGTITFGGLQFGADYAVVTVQTSAGVVKAWDGGYTTTANSVTVDNAGAVDWAATDVVIVQAFANS